MNGFIYNTMPNFVYVSRPERYLDKKAVGEYINKRSYKTINKFLKSGKIKAIDTPVGKVFKRSDIDKYMETLPRSYAK